MIPGSILENKIMINNNSLTIYIKNNSSNNNSVRKVVFSPGVDCVWLMSFSHAIKLINQWLFEIFIILEEGNDND